MSTKTTYEREEQVEHPNFTKISREQLDAELEKGLADYKAGRVVSAKQVHENMQRKYQA